MLSTKKSVRIQQDVLEGVEREALRLDRKFNWTVNHLLRAALMATERHLQEGKNKKGTHR